MTNILNSIIANQPLQQPVQRDVLPAFTFDSQGKIKPLEHKGQLLPSKIFSSPKEYAHDLKKDIVSLGKAAKGQANDHELGRINDLAMKLGAVGLAAYLFVKNPLKLSKAMEFVGIGTFFGGMSLWPKLTIQAPLKARTGVDIHQKYIDSQGRKKMLHQDPQYDLTDLYSREDLDLMGEKLKVDENLPDRDNFIKQRAKKVAVQGNTLWMMSAFTTPIISALSCKALEKPIDGAIEKFELISSARKLEKGAVSGPIQKIKDFMSNRAFEKFLSSHANTPMDDAFMSELADKLAAGTNSPSLREAIKQQLAALKGSAKVSESIVRDSVKSLVPDSVFAALTEEQQAVLSSKISEGSAKGIANFLAKLVKPDNEVAREGLSKKIQKAISQGVKSAENKPMTAEVTEQVRSMRSSLQSFASGRALIDGFIGPRVAKNAGTYNARQWNKVCDYLLKSLRLSGKELKELADGNMDILDRKMAQLAKDDIQYAKVVEKLARLIEKYDIETGSIPSKISESAGKICESAREGLAEKGFTIVADKIKSGAGSQVAGTVENAIVSDAKGKVAGELSSFYRLLQALDLYKQKVPSNNNLAESLRKALDKQGAKSSKDLVKICTDIINGATTADHVVKLRGDGLNLTEDEYKAVMKVLFGSSDSTSGIERTITDKFGDEADKILAGFKKYKEDFMTHVAGWKNGVDPKTERFVVEGAGKAAEEATTFAKQNDLIGSSVSSTMQQCAKKAYNTNKWLKIFGVALAAVTAVTLIAGLTFGKKSKMEKEAEKESKING